MASMLSACLFTLLHLANPTVVSLGFFAQGISGDGETVVGYTAGSRPCIWTARDGTKELPVDSGFTSGAAYQASRDGSVIVGQVWSGREKYACIWRRGNMKVIVKQATLDAPAISADGSTVVGTLSETVEVDPKTTSNGRRLVKRDVAFRWTERDGLALLRPLDPDLPQCSVRACSADGSLVFGSATVRPRLNGPVATMSDVGVIVPCRWDRNGTPTSLQRTDERFATVVVACSDDGSVVCGAGASQGGRAVTWSKNGRMRYLAMPSPRFGYVIEGVSGDGSTFFGIRGDGCPVIWTANSGCETLDGFLRTRGVDDLVPSRRIRAVSSNGTVFVLLREAAAGPPSGWLIRL